MKNWKTFLLVFLGLILLLFGVGVWVFQGRLSEVSRSDFKNLKGDEYFENLSDRYETRTIGKSLVEDKNMVSFQFVGIIVNGLTLETWGGLTGKIVIDGDEMQREIPLSVNNDMVYFGVFDSSFNGNSSWTYVGNEKVSELVSVGTKVLIKVSHIYDGKGEEEEFFFDHDQVLDALLKDIISKEWNYLVPDDFYIHVVDMGVLL